MTNQELERRGYEIIWDGRLGPRVPVERPTLPNYAQVVHAPRKRPQAQIDVEIAAVLSCLEKQPCSRWQLRKATGLSEQSIAVTINQLKRAGRIEQAHFGTWTLAHLFDKDIAK